MLNKGCNLQEVEWSYFGKSFCMGRFLKMFGVFDVGDFTIGRFDLLPPKGQK